MGEILSLKQIAAIAAAERILTPAEYFAEKAKRGPPLKPLGRPCHDCAVVDGFYRDYSDALAEQPPEIVREASLRWFCHNHPNRACRGNIDNCAALRTGEG